MQYSQVEQSIQQTGLLKDVLARLSAQDMMEAAGLIGRTVEVAGADARLTAAGTEWRWSVPRPATEVAAEVQDSTGRVVARLDVPAGSGGQLSWDGKLADGSTAAPGTYRLRLTAADQAGAAIPVSIQVRGRVTDVVAGGNGLLLSLDGHQVPFRDVLAVSAA